MQAEQMQDTWTQDTGVLQAGRGTLQVGCGQIG